MDRPTNGTEAGRGHRLVPRSPRRDSTHKVTADASLAETRSEPVCWPTCRGSDRRATHPSCHAARLDGPQVNEWDDQPTLEIVRQLVETGGFCFLDKDKRGDLKVWCASAGRQGRPLPRAEPIGGGRARSRGTRVQRDGGRGGPRPRRAAPPLLVLCALEARRSGNRHAETATAGYSRSFRLALRSGVRDHPPRVSEGMGRRVDRLVRGGVFRGARSIERVPPGKCTLSRGSGDVGWNRSACSRGRGSRLRQGLEGLRG